MFDNREFEFVPAVVVDCLNRDYCFCSAMESYQEVGGVPMASSKEYLKSLLRHKMGFEGMMVTDYSEIKNLHDWHLVAASQKEAVQMAMSETSIDMSMVPTGR